MPNHIILSKPNPLSIKDVPLGERLKISKKFGSAHKMMAQLPTPFKINIIWDVSVRNAPAGFKTGVQKAVNMFQSLYNDPITVNITVGYGEENGNTLGPSALGQSQYYLNAGNTYLLINTTIRPVQPSAANMMIQMTGSIALSSANIIL